MNVTRQCPLKPGSQFRKDAEFQQWLGRREWIKRFALGTAATLGSNLVSPVMAEIVAGANPANIIKINLNSYPALLTDYGSVRFNLFGSTVTNGIITVTRAPGPVYYSMSAYCTHAGCIVEAYDNSPGTEAMICYCHSSVYNIQGQIITEATANQPNLPAYNTSLEGSTLRVEIPNLNLKVNSITPVTGTQRYRLIFPVKQGGKYRILYTPDLTTTPTVTSFSNSQAGSIDQTVFNSPSNNTAKSVWVQNAAVRGFYMVEMIMSEYVP
jgi:Rieske Fe-S protein